MGDTFRTAGIAHLLAVSGLHVALLCGLFAMGQGRRSRFSVPRVLLQITVLLLYMGLTGLPFSVFRAGVMFLIMLVGSLCSSRRIPLPRWRWPPSSLGCSGLLPV